MLIALAIVTVVYFVSHLYNFTNAPGNAYGYREYSITKDFLENLKNEGFKVVAGNLKDLYEVLFSKSSALR